jgi:hypothetical protein
VHIQNCGFLFLGFFLISVILMELFVTYANELSSVGGPVSVVIPVRSPPGTDIVILSTWPLAVECFPFPGDSLAL